MEHKTKKVNTEEIRYIIFDFDQTICAKHLHGECLKIVSLNPKKFPNRIPLRQDQLEIWDSEAINFLWEKLHADHQLITSGNKEDWRNLFISLIDNEYHVVIASFSSFKPVIERFVKEIIQLPEEYFAKVSIEAWLPQNQANKNAHIDRIILGIPAETDINFASQLLDTKKREELYKQIILIDDVAQNTDSIFELVGPNHALLVQPKSANTPQKIIAFLNQHLAFKIK